MRQQTTKNGVENPVIFPVRPEEPVAIDQQEPKGQITQQQDQWTEWLLESVCPLNIHQPTYIRDKKNLEHHVADICSRSLIALQAVLST